MTRMIRTTERVTVDTRFVAQATLSTGKLVTWATDWKPAQWDPSDLRRSALVAAQGDLSTLAERYAVQHGAIRVYAETRRLEHITETRISRRFESEHAPEGEPT